MRQDNHSINAKQYSSFIELQCMMRHRFAQMSRRLLAICAEIREVLHSALQCFVDGHLWHVPKILLCSAAVQLAICLYYSYAHWREL